MGHASAPSAAPPSLEACRYPGCRLDEGTPIGCQDNNQPMFLVALEEQLGLKLELRRTEVSVVVIDSVERPALD